jgi:hypothetical protein
MAYRHITERDIANHPAALRDLQQRHFGQTSMDGELLARFNAASLYAGLAEEKDAPYSTRDGTHEPFIIRAHTTLWFLNKTQYEAFKLGRPIADVEPWQAGDGAAYAFVTFAVSQVPNGFARLMADLFERLPTHAAYAQLKEIFWYTRSIKGAMITNYLDAEPLPDVYSVKAADGASQHYPFYRISCEGGMPAVQAIIDNMLGIENNFAREVIQSK